MPEIYGNFKEYLEAKDAVFGVFTKTNDPFFIEILGRAGFDFVILDSEHGPNDLRALYPLIMAARLNNMYPVVRVPKLTDIDIQRVMDLGVSGVQIPQIQCKEDALNVKRYTRFHPKGLRGLCRFVRPADFSLKDKNEYFAEQNDVTTIIHIEGVEGINNLDEIIQVEDIDIIFIGPYDLSQSMGIPGEVEHPKLLVEIEKIVEKCKTYKKHIGIFTENVPLALKYKALGIKYISYSVDVGIFAEACSSIVKQLNEADVSN